MMSIVVPVHDNASTLLELIERCRAAVDSPELCFVDDCSRDESVAVLRANGVKLVQNATRLGQHASIMAGMAIATGDIVCVLDADLQDAPEAIPRLVSALGDADCVFALRTGQYTRLGRYVTGRAFFALRAALGGPPFGTGTFFVAQRSVVTRACDFAGDRPYVPSLVYRCARHAVTVPIKRSPRSGGGSSYSSAMRVAVATRAIVRTLSYRAIKP